MNEQELHSILLNNWGVAHVPRPLDLGQLDKLRSLNAHIASINGKSDDRREINASPAPVQELAKSVALICDAPLLVRQSNGVWELQTQPTGLLSGQAFSEQPKVPGGFTGFLVGKDLLLTTAHDVANVGLLRVIFDYKLATNGVAKTTYSSGEIFTVTEVDRGSAGKDWLLLRLDRSPNRPFQVISSQAAPLGSSLWMLGHPLGLPMKFVDNAVVTKEDASVFECDLDASKGNSGSMVLAPGSGVVGVLQGTAPALVSGVWLWCLPTQTCPTFVTSSPTFAASVAAAGP